LVVVNIDSVPIEITVIYLSREALRADYQATLQNSALTIDDPRLTELYQPVDVKIQLPDGASVEVSGQTVAQTPNGMAVALDLDATQRALIETVNAR
jgi:predicted ATPase